MTVYEALSILFASWIAILTLILVILTFINKK
jgi:hypothetical protein